MTESFTVTGRSAEFLAKAGTQQTRQALYGVLDPRFRGDYEIAEQTLRRLLCCVFLLGRARFRQIAHGGVHSASAMRHSGKLQTHLAARERAH
jgi:hypothetical protein